MILDETYIRKCLCDSEEEMKKAKEHNQDSIYISSSLSDFDPQNQIGNDSIDLRIGNKGYVLNNSYEYINTLADENFEKYFKEVELSLVSGYDLKPGEVLFIETLERIHLSGALIGRVSGRSTFARFGISVHCTQEKFSSGINSVVALQIKNNTRTTLKIFPYQKLAQMMIEKTSRNPSVYIGSYKSDAEYKFPVVKQSDREQYDARTQTCILRLKPKEKSVLNKYEKAARLISVAQSILGFIITTIIGICCAFLNNTFVVGIIILNGVLYIAQSIFFYKVLTKIKDSE